jgi:hypothetical protein
LFAVKVTAEVVRDGRCRHAIQRRAEWRPGGRRDGGQGHR